MAREPGAGRDEEAVRRFIERFALNLAEAGMARMPARVFAALLAEDDGRLTAARTRRPAAGRPGGDLRRGALPDPAADGLPRARARGTGRHYRVSADMWYEVVARRDQILARWEQDLQDGIKAVGPDTPAGARLEENRQYFEFLRHEAPQVMAKWRELRSAKRAD